jgi:ring-1,2-phenylacetyl-CoA epoxidase subunit PaaD
VPLTLTVAPVHGIACPVCGSADTERTAAFGSTACKDLYRCRACAEPFEHIKEI